MLFQLHSLRLEFFLACSINHKHEPFDSVQGIALLNMRATKHALKRLAGYNTLSTKIIRVSWLSAWFWVKWVLYRARRFGACFGRKNIYVYVLYDWTGIHSSVQ